MGLVAKYTQVTSFYIRFACFNPNWWSLWAGCCGSKSCLVFKPEGLRITVWTCSSPPEARAEKSAIGHHSLSDAQAFQPWQAAGPWSSGQLHCNLFPRWQRTERTNRARLEASVRGAGRSRCCQEPELGHVASLLESPQSSRTSEAYNCNFKPQKKTEPFQTFILLRKRMI